MTSKLEQGETATARRLAAGYLRLDNEEDNHLLQRLTVADTHPEVCLNGDLNGKRC